jgi:hypothetical protein
MVFEKEIRLKQNKTKQMKNLLLLITLTITTFSFSQTDADNCKKYRGLTGMYAGQKAWRDAANFFVQSYTSCGLEGLEKSDWNNAKIIYKNLIKGEKDEARKVELKDSLIWVFEKGDTYGVDAKWKADYVTELVKLKSDSSDLCDELYANSIHTLKAKASTSHIKYYYTYLVRKFIKFQKSEEMDEMEEARTFAIDEYLVLSDYVSENVKKYTAAGSEKKVGYWKGVQTLLDQYFVKLAKDPKVLTDVLGKKMNSLPAVKEDKIEKVKGYLALLEKRDCGSTDLYGQLADTLILLEPTSAAFYAQGTFFYNKEEYSKAKGYYTKAMEMEADGENKDKFRLGLARAQSASRSYKAAFKTAKSVGGEYRSDAMKICAGAIAATANSCGDTSFDRKANFWLANDYMKKSNSGSSTYLSNAPNDNEIFEAGKEKGSRVSLPCWGESTTIR